MVRLPFDARSHETASVFNISEPLICWGRLIPYSRSHPGSFIYELSNMSPAKRPNLMSPSGSRRPSIHPQRGSLSVVAGLPERGGAYRVAAGGFFFSHRSLGDPVTMTEKAN